MLLKRLIVLSVLMMSLSVISVADANDDLSFQSRRERREKNIQEVYNQLSLTDAQKQQLEQNKINNQGKKKDLYEKIRSYKEMLNQELMKIDLDMTKINNIQGSIKALQMQILDDRLNSILEVRKILTPEQFTKFIGFMKEARQERFKNDEKQ
ncbi:MAG: Spy/CpxP family protein refolding chaperone [Candidatus Omnitrophica bacterium]|nr:Spy/CpxP family protein refolding chaperone [Candidatus Omnitrophota bacterium]